MKKLLQFVDEKLLKFGVAFAILFTALYPKLPSIHIVHTWVYIRLEDFLIGAITLIWLAQVYRKKIKIPFAETTPFIFFWLTGLLSLIFSMIFIAPHIANYFASVAVLNYIRRIEYMVLFFVALSTVRNLKDIRDYLIILMVTITGIVLYGFGQRWYIVLWSLFPKFFEKFSFCFPSFQTGNEEFAKGIPLCLPSDARITSTFGGHYDLAGFLVLTIPIIFGILLSFKNLWIRIYAFILTIGSIILLILTASRISFVAYLIGISCMLVFSKKKKLILPILVLSVILLLMLNGSTAKRFLETIRFANVVTNSEGTVVGVTTGSLPKDLQSKISKNPVIVAAPPPSQNLPTGSGFIGLPQLTTPVATSVAVVQSSITSAQQKKLKLANGGVEISTISGTFLVQKALVYDISFTTRFQGEWPNAWNAFLRNPVLGSGYATITLATDSDYFRALGETGILGLISFSLVFMYLGVLLYEGKYKLTNPIEKNFAFALSGGVIGLFVNASFIDVFEASKIAEPLWILLGLGAGVMLLVHKEKINYGLYLKKIFSSYTLIIIYLSTVLGVVFFSSISNFFVGDDFTWLRWAASSGLHDIIRYFTDAQGFFYRPLDKLAVFFLFSLFAFKPEGYHIFTLLIHLATSFGVYLFLLATLKKKLPAFLGSVIFMVLPGHGENIYWFSTISVSLSALFMLYGSVFWIYFRNTKKTSLYILSFLLSVLGLLSYEGSVVFPLLLLATDVILFSKKDKKMIAEYIPFALTTILYFLTRIYVHSAGFSGDYSYSIVKFVPNLFGNILGYSGVFITGEFFLPVYFILRETLKNYWIEAIVLFILVLGALINFLRKRQGIISQKLKDKNFHLWIFAISFAIIPLFPFLGLGNISERYLYLSSVGFIMVFVMLIGEIKNTIQKSQGQTKSLALYLAIAVAFIIVFALSVQKESYQWSKAGNITKNTLTDLKLYNEFILPDSTMYFVNLPIKYQNAWVYPVGLEDSIWFVYRDSLPRIKLAKSIDSANSMANNDPKVSYIFSFDKNFNLKEIR